MTCSPACCHYTAAAPLETYSIRTSIRAGIRAGIRTSIRAGIKTSIRAGIRKGIRAGIRIGIRTSIRTSIRTGIRQVSGQVSTPSAGVLLRTPGWNLSGIYQKQETSDQEHEIIRWKLW